MQIQSLSSANQAIDFKSRNNMERAVAFVNMDDNQLKDLAYLKSYDGKAEKKQRRTLSATLLAIPVVDSLASGILVKRGEAGLNEAKALRATRLGERVAATAKSARGWAAALVGIGIYNGIKRAIVSRSEGMQEFNKKHPGLSLITDLCIIMAGFVFGEKAYAKLKNNIKTKDPELANLVKARKDSIKESLDNTKFSKEVIPAIAKRVSKFARKHPAAAKASRLGLMISPIVVFGLGLLRIAHNEKKELKRIDNNYEQLKDIQLKTAKKLAKVISVQRDVLAQNQIMAEKELSHRPAREHHPEPDED